MRVVVGRVAKGRTAWADQAAEHYLGRIKRFVPVEELSVRPVDFGDDRERARREEARRLGALLKPADHVVVLDERGEAVDTREFKRLLEACQYRSVQRVVFLIGGAHGHHPSLRDRADRLCCLSPLVLNHQLARLVLLEQVYRAFTLMRGVPYHH